MKLHSFFLKSLCSLAFFFFVINVSAQRVGIGTNTPAEKLEVTGNVKADTIKSAALKISSNAGNGKVLTSDATGNASWQNAGSGASSVGFGSWGDCATNAAISEYNPVADSTGAENDILGRSVSISGNFAIGGANLDDVNGNIDQGSASIFQFNGTQWVMMQKITDATGAASDNFGFSVAISGNFAIVGAYKDDIGVNTDQGSASIFQFNGSNWVLMQKITDATGAANDWFGYAVSISGNRAIIGANLDDVGAKINQGSASIFQYDGANWVLMQKIVQGSGAAGDQFGNSVSIAGFHAIVGASNDAVGVNNRQGSASIFTNIGGSWIQVNYLTDPSGVEDEFFGTSVSMSGIYAIVGTPEGYVGLNQAQGSVSIYINSGGWNLMQKITDPGGQSSSAFGLSVQITEKYAIISDAYATSLSNRGSAHIYIRIGSVWMKLHRFFDPATELFNSFGLSVAVDPTSKRFVIGTPGAFNGRGKLVFGKIN